MNGKTFPLKGRLVAVLLLLCALAGPAGASDRRVALDVSLGSKALAADQTQTAYLRVGLTGFPREAAGKRPPVNLAIVLDHSGSMGGEKLERAREAAIQAIRRLDKEDILSVVIYDSTAEVVVPATRLSDREAVFEKIRSIRAGSSTALYAGVDAGAQEVRKFLSLGHANRILLLSDGLANVGPQSPGDLGRLGAALGGEGITVSTIGLGLGYNEDLMTQLAGASDGNHFFAENASDLVRTFDAEFGRATSVAARKVCIEIHCGRGVRPVRVLGREAEISGSRVALSMNQLYHGNEKYAIVEVEVSATPAGKSRQVAEVEVRYENPATQGSDRLHGSASVRFTASKEEAEKCADARTLADVVEQIAVERNRAATALRDQGRIEEARKALLSNNEYLQINARVYGSAKLRSYGAANEAQAGQLEEKDWNRNRKGMLQMQYELQRQQ